MINDNIKDSYSTGLADPFIYRFDGDYYLLFTAPKGLKAFKSHDLVTFEEVDNGVNAKGFVAEDEKLVAAYAPELIHFNGYFYIITSMGGNGHHILRAKSIIGPYEFITGNIHESIDGSFFINDDEEIYVTRASETGIALNKLEPDFTKFKLNEYGVIDSLTFEEARTFGWTEGPYILKRYGKYYLTYTGTHFLSDAYRVNYAVGDSVFLPDSFKFKDTILLSLTDDFYGLGHSATFLAPNLDSYYLCYHDMNPNGVRTINFSRLMFAGKNMLANDVNNDLHPNIELADFETRKLSELSFKNEGYFYLNSFSKGYTFEVTYYNENEPVYFGYKDEKNKFYARTAANLVEIHSVVDGVDEIIFEKKFKYEYLKNSLKTLRIQAKNEHVNLYFNNIELASNLWVKNSVLGDVGFTKNFDLSYFAISKYSFGNSDNEEIKFIDKIFASNFDLDSKISQEFDQDFIVVNHENKPKYFVYVREEGEYHLDANFVNKFESPFTINVRANENIFTSKIELDDSDETHHVNDVYLKKGINEIEFSTDTEFCFNYFKFSKILGFCSDFEEKLTENSEKLHHFGRPVFTNGGLYFDNDRNFTRSKDVYFDFTASVEMTVRGNPDFFSGDVAGLVVLNNKYGKKNAFEQTYSLDGLFFGYNAKSIYIIDVDFDKTKVLKEEEFSGSNHKKLSVKKVKNKLEFYIDDQLYYTHKIKEGNIRGHVGVYNVHTSVYFKNLSIRRN